MNYDNLKKVIQQTNPEIMELKFGCYVNGLGYSNARLCLVADDEVTLRVGHYGIDTEPLSEFGNRIKILGRPIRLADVLLALENNVRVERGIRMMDVPGTISLSDAINHTLSYWNLEDDDLDNQIEETRQFLINLLA